jgi:autotransporter translocation and assembly factor TamB
VEGLEGELVWSGGPAGAEAATAHVQAARLTIARGDRARRLDRLSLRATGTAEAVSVEEAEFYSTGARFRARGRIVNAARDPRLDLEMRVQAPINAVLSLLGADRQVEGTLVVDGRLEGPWDQVAFRGAGRLQLGSEPNHGGTLPFSIRWADGRVEVEGRGGSSEGEGAFQGLLSFTPATGAYAVRARLSQTNLAALRDLLLGLGWSHKDLPLPAAIRGWLAADVDLSGRTGDPTASRGNAVLSVDGLTLEGATPTGHLEARIAANGSHLEVETFDLRTAAGEIQGHGTLNSSTGKLELPLRATLRDVGAFARGFGLRVLDGQAELLGHVTGTREEPRLEGRLTWRGARIAGQRIDLIEGDMQLAPRVLSTTGLVLRSGQGRATVRGSLQMLGTPPIGRANLEHELSLDVQGELDSAIGLIPGDIDIGGRFRASGRLTGALERLNGDITIGLEDVRTWEESWTRGGAVVRFREGDVEITGIDFRRGAERVMGQLTLPADGSLQGRLQSTSMDLAHVDLLARRGLAGHASFRLDLQGTRQASRFLIQTNGTDVFWRGIAMGAATGSLRVERKVLNMDITFLEGTHRLQAQIGPPPASLFAGELTLSDADLAPVLQAANVEALRPWRPQGDGRIVIRGRPEDSGATRGEAELESLRLTLNGSPFESQGPVRATWDGRDFNLEPVRLRSGGHEVQVSGGGTGNGIDLELTGEVPLAAVADHFKGLAPLTGVAAGTLRLRGSQASPDAWGMVEIGQGHFRLEGFPLELQDVHATVDLQGDRIDVPQYRAMVAGGSLRGNAEFRRNEGRSHLAVAFQQDDGRVEEVLEAIVGEQREITGRVSLAGAVSSDADATTGPAESLTGSLSLRMRDGLIGRYTVLAKMLALLNLADLVEAQGPDLTSRGMPYQQITADFKIERGHARTENLVLKSPAVRMTAAGSIDLAAKTVDMAVGVQPFQNVDRIVSSIPVAGWLLTGKEKSVVVAYFKVSGPLRDPQVSSVPVKSVGRDVFGILQNLLALPESFSRSY